MALKLTGAVARIRPSNFIGIVLLFVGVLCVGIRIAYGADQPPAAPEIWTGAGGSLAVLIYLLSQRYWDSRRGPSPEEVNKALIRMVQSEDRMVKMLDDIQKRTQEMHQWHNVKDHDGVPVWYVRRSLEDAIIKLAATIDKQTEFFSALTLASRDQKRDIEEIKEAVEKIVERS